MNTATMIRDAKQDGVKITLTSAGKIHLEGERAPREKWAGIVKARRSEIVEALKAANDAQLTSWRWLIHFRDHEPLEVSFSPEATRDEVLSMYPPALSAEPVQDVRQPLTSMTREEEQAIRGWLSSIGEDDPAIIEETIEQCRKDAGARSYFLQRATTEPFDPEAWEGQAAPSWRHVGIAQLKSPGAARSTALARMIQTGGQAGNVGRCGRDQNDPPGTDRVENLFER